MVDAGLVHTATYQIRSRPFGEPRLSDRSHHLEGFTLMPSCYDTDFEQTPLSRRDTIPPMSGNDPSRSVIDTHIVHIQNGFAAASTPPCPIALSRAMLLEAWQPCIAPRGFLVLWGLIIDHPRLVNGPIATSRLLAIDRRAGWAVCLRGLIRLGLGTARPRSSAMPPHLSGAGRHFLTFEAAGYIPIQCPTLLESLLADFGQTVRLLTGR